MTLESPTTERSVPLGEERAHRTRRFSARSGKIFPRLAR
jgi:hypothetical protein